MVYGFSKLSKSDIDMIIEGSELTEKDVSNSLRKTTDEAQEYIKKTQDLLNSNKIRITKTEEEEMSDAAFNKYCQYCSNTLIKIDQTIYQLSTQAMSVMTQYITQCTSARRRLERELIRKRNS